VVEQGNAQQVIEDPQHEYSRLLISSIPVPDPRVKWDTSVVLPVEEKA
jgi:peptide/nickel transport system ATP-binding protein